jgi:large subunit ribosomal protein L18e
MKIRAKNPIIKSLIIELIEKGYRENIPAWIAIAQALNKPRRSQKKINLWKIEKYAKKGETVIVPSCVLGNGKLTKPVNVVALKFSASAKKGILDANGKCIDIKDITKIKPSGIRIME